MEPVPQEKTDLYNGDLAHATVASIIVYTFMLFLLRFLGARAFAKLSMTDFITSIAIGTAIGRASSTSGSVSASVVAIALLFSLQFVGNYLIVHFPKARFILQPEPQVLVFRGRIDYEALRYVILSEIDVFTALRALGYGDVTDIEAIILEPGGDFSVVRRNPDGSPPLTLTHVRKYQQYLAAAPVAIAAATEAAP